jgi:hypothetical protein
MIRFVLALLAMLFWAGAAHAQQIPEFVVWSAGAALFAPFVAVPIKLGLLRLLAFSVDPSRLWAIAAIEWLLWFPLAFLVLRSGRSGGLPMTLLALLFAAVWLHRVRIPTERWAFAFWLALPTPLLALALPFAAIGAVMLAESAGR